MRQPSAQSAKQKALNQACTWMGRLWADDATEADRLACAQWRQADVLHEQAWLEVSQLQNQFTAVTDSQAALQVLTQPPIKKGRRNFVWSAVCVGLSSSWLFHRFTQTTDQPDWLTAVGEQHTLTLLDGTRLVLNTDTAVNIRYEGTRPFITLVQGEIWLSSGSSALPHTVQTKHGHMQPIGTAYQVRLWPDQTQLAVYDGQVQLQTLATRLKHTVSAGQQLSFTEKTIQPLHAMAETSPSWLEGKLAVSSMPLGEFVAELSRYHAGKIQLDPVLAHLTVTGVFRLHDTQQVLVQLGEVLPIKVHTYTRYWTRVVSP